MVDGGSTIDGSADLINDVTVSELFRFREKKNTKLETLFGIFFFTLCNFEAETCNSLQKVGIEARLAPGHMVLVWY